MDQALAVSKSRVFFSSGNNRFLAVDATSGQIAWSVKIEDYSYEPVISRDRVFVGGQRELLMLDTETGKKFETVKLGRDVAFTPVLQDGTAIIYNGDGYFFAMKK